MILDVKTEQSLLGSHSQQHADIESDPPPYPSEETHSRCQSRASPPSPSTDGRLTSSAPSLVRHPLSFGMSVTPPNLRHWHLLTYLGIARGITSHDSHPRDGQCNLWILKFSNGTPYVYTCGTTRRAPFTLASGKAFDPRIYSTQHGANRAHLYVTASLSATPGISVFNDTRLSASAEFNKCPCVVAHELPEHAIAVLPNPTIAYDERRI